MKRHNSQRGYFAYDLWKEMGKNKSIFVLTGDLGYGMFDDIKKDYPDRFINVGASEQSLLDIGVGLALSGKIPVCYSITPFLLYRGFETIRNYINHEKIKVLLVGGGRDKDYLNDGFSHWAEEEKKVMRLFSKINTFRPNTKEDIPLISGLIKYNWLPAYINLKR